MLPRSRDPANRLGITERIDEALAAGAVAHVYKANAWDDLIPTIRAAVARQQQH